MIAPLVLLGLTSLFSLSDAHVAAWAPGMYCKGGNTTGDDQNTNTAVNPLFNLPQEEWFFQRDRNCDKFPPPPGEFLELPAGGSFTVELAHNRGQTTLSFNGQFTSEWPDGKEHPEDWNAVEEGTPCISSDFAMHCQNQTMAAGSAFAISYVSDLEDVTMENLAVFTTLDHTPWKRLATYAVPALPACPEGGCMCAWLWVADGCGEPNIYMHGFKCNVTGATSTKAVASAKAPVYCADNPSICVKGAKQMIAWNQQSGNNIELEQPLSPGYNSKCGWSSGAQNDIFED